MGEIRFTLPQRQGKHAREVLQEVWAQTLSLPDGERGFVQTTCLVARKTEPHEDDKAVEWRLLTNLPVATLDQAAKMIAIYC